MQPRQELLREYVPRWPEPCRLIEGTEVEMCFRRQPLAFAGQCRPALGAEFSLHARRRTELGDLAVGDRCEKRDRPTAMPPTTLAIAPPHPFRLTGGHKAHRGAQAAASN
jgi:hypothetical protein